MSKSAQDRRDSAVEATERTQQEQQGLVERLRQLETATFESPSRTSLHALGQDLVPIVVSVVVKGCRTLRRHRKAGKTRREVLREVRYEAPDI